ncbi:MAG: hypothetical protein JWQ72_3471 [Polaromonas sp.]|nr:hypothetical protein [Polaromonas sp.]
MLTMAGFAAAFAAGLLVVPAGAFAAVKKDPGDKEAIAFSSKDWELRCDNTLTCRAAGYQAEAGASEPVSLLLTRSAGPGSKITVDVQVGGETSPIGPMRFTVGKVSVHGLKGDTSALTQDQVRAVLPALLREDVATVQNGSRTWTLSLAGANAALLKMDEVQGRLNTPGAIVRRGQQPEASAKPAVAAPLVRNLLPVAARPGDEALAAVLFPLLDLTEAKEQCNESSKFNAKSLQVSRLTAGTVLLSLGCSMGAYNYSSLNWIASDKPPHAPRAIEADGEFDAAAGTITSSMKGRGIGDCWSSRTWHFTGKDFALSRDSGDHMCRGFAGGAWDLTSYTARPALQPASSPKKP